MGQVTEILLPIRRVAVLGTGVMGTEIAMHLSEQGLNVLLFGRHDGKITKERFNSAARSRNLSADALALVECFQFKSADERLLNTADLVIESIVEDLDEKCLLFERIAVHLKNGAIVTSNTSGLSIGKLALALPKALQSRFYGAHFLNPVMRMRLIEIVVHDGSDKTLLGDLVTWLELRLDKTTIVVKNTPNFVTTRIGSVHRFLVIRHMEQLGLNPETVDFLLGPLTGQPKSAIFRTMDLVGIDLILATRATLSRDCPDDPFLPILTTPSWLTNLVAQGRLGAKTKNEGMYRKGPAAGLASTWEVFSPTKQSYVKPEVLTFPSTQAAAGFHSPMERLDCILQHNDRGAQFVWLVWRDLLVYCTYLLIQISDGRVSAIDRAMVYGRNWHAGPFATWQWLGFRCVVERMLNDGLALPSWLVASPDWRDFLRRAKDNAIQGDSWSQFFLRAS